MMSIACDVGEVVSLGRTHGGERRYVPILGGTAAGPELAGVVVSGGVDWQVNRDDGVLDIAAHYVLRSADGALVEVTSDGMRYGPPEVMERLARGERVARDDYYFRTVMRFRTGAAAWLHLNRTIALAVGEREPARVLLDVYRVG
jgi:hypothetical protein